MRDIIYISEDFTSSSSRHGWQLETHRTHCQSYIVKIDGQFYFFNKNLAFEGCQSSSGS